MQNPRTDPRLPPRREAGKTTNPPHPLQTLLQSVSLPFSEIEEMDKQITAWEKESISEKGSVAQNLKEKIRANEEKLNKLVSVFLDGDIESEMDLKGKDLLMREKGGWLESERKFGEERKSGGEGLGGWGWRRAPPRFFPRFPQIIWVPRLGGDGGFFRQETGAKSEAILTNSICLIQKEFLLYYKCTQLIDCLF